MHFSLPPQIYYYADSIYATAGVEQNDIQYVTVGTGAVNVFMTIAAVGAQFIQRLKSYKHLWRWSLMCDHISRRW